MIMFTVIPDNSLKQDLELIYPEHQIQSLC